MGLIPGWMKLAGAALLIAALVAGYLAWAGHQRAIGDARGAARVQGQWDAARKVQEQQAAAAEIEYRQVEQRRSRNIVEALNAASQRESALRAAVSAGARTADGLRNDLATAAAARNVPSYSLATCRRDLSTRDAVLGAMEQAGRGMAEAADRSESEVKTLRDAWPTN